MLCGVQDRKRDKNMVSADKKAHSVHENILSTLSWPFSGKSLWLNKDTNNNFLVKTAASGDIWNVR
jgi:hypothetical protein